VRGAGGNGGGASAVFGSMPNVSFWVAVRRLVGRRAGGDEDVLRVSIALALSIAATVSVVSRLVVFWRTTCDREVFVLDFWPMITVVSRVWTNAELEWQGKHNLPKVSRRRISMP
jgi:hypothetical protein